MAQQDYSSAVTDIKTAPHSIPTDGPVNPGFAATQPVTQHPFAEATLLSVNTSA